MALFDDAVSDELTVRTGEDCHVWNGRLASNPLFAEGKKKALPCN